MNKQDHKKELSRVKLLLLGTGESGKSTIFKQMKILYSTEKGYTQKEREQAKPYIYGNIFSNLRVVVENADKYGPIHDVPAKMAFLSYLKADDEPAPEINPHIANILKTLWRDPGLQATWKERTLSLLQDFRKMAVLPEMEAD